MRGPKLRRYTLRPPHLLRAASSQGRLFHLQPQAATSVKHLLPSFFFFFLQHKLRSKNVNSITCHLLSSSGVILILGIILLFVLTAVACKQHYIPKDIQPTDQSMWPRDSSLKGIGQHFWKNLFDRLCGFLLYAI